DVMRVGEKVLAEALARAVTEHAGDRTLPEIGVSEIGVSAVMREIGVRAVIIARQTSGPARTASGQLLQL
ncbi:MAG: hypothetical protein KGJ25_15030, partial [Betaproteobacteria bacterium]|nr:hypothetical protein [Betaproteobacteria bacterium]